MKELKFDERFAMSISDRIKTTTIRKSCDYDVGDVVPISFGKYGKLAGYVEIKFIDDISFRSVTQPAVKINGDLLCRKSIEALIQFEGYSCLLDMTTNLRAYYGMPFKGYFISFNVVEFFLDIRGENERL